MPEREDFEVQSRARLRGLTRTVKISDTTRESTE